MSPALTAAVIVVTSGHHASSSSSHNYRGSTQTPIQPDYQRTVTVQPKEPPTPAQIRESREMEQFGILLGFGLMVVVLALLITKCK